MVKRIRGGRRAFVVVELIAVTAIIAILLSLGFSVYRGARRSAFSALAENNLKQAGTALELYFGRYGHYPLQGANLVTELTPFVHDPDIFANPLREEEVPGEDLSEFYFPPTLSETDGGKGKYYTTAFTSDDGHTAIVLYTGGSVEVVSSITYNPDSPTSLIHELTGMDVISGPLNVDPRNNDTCDFTMCTASGEIITRSDLLGSKGRTGFNGRILWLQTWPKGTGNSNFVQVNGNPLLLKNGRLYTIAAGPNGRFNVKFCNASSDTKTSEAMGDYWVDLLCVGGTITAGK